MGLGRVWAALLLSTLIGVAAGHAHRQGDPSLVIRRRLASGELPQPAHRACGTHLDLPVLKAQVAAAERKTYGVVQAAMSSQAALAAAVQQSAFPTAGVALPINFHVIHWQGYSSTIDLKTPPVSNQQIAEQIAVLNRDYKGTGVQFAKPVVRFVENQSWAADCWGKLGEILAAVNRAPGSSVNVVLCDLASSVGILGVMPDMPNEFNEHDASQAVAIDFRSMPGGPYSRYSGGRTLTHELGHYFGLSHTFGGEESCGASGGADGILDTPAQSTSSNGCPVGQDSCPGQPGEDSVHNFMDYSDDSCMTYFSLGQAARMQAVMLQYRPVLLASAVQAAGAMPPPAPPLPPPRKPVSAPRGLSAGQVQPPQVLRPSPPQPSPPQLLSAGRLAPPPLPKVTPQGKKAPPPPLPKVTPQGTKAVPPPLPKATPQGTKTVSPPLPKATPQGTKTVSPPTPAPRKASPLSQQRKRPSPPPPTRAAAGRKRPSPPAPLASRKFGGTVAIN